MHQSYRITRNQGDTGMKYVRVIGKAARRSVATMTEAQAGLALIGSTATVIALVAAVASLTGLRGLYNDRRLCRIRLRGVSAFNLCRYGWCYMSRKVWRPLNTYGLIFIALIAFGVMGYELALL